MRTDKRPDLENVVYAYPEGSWEWSLARYALDLEARLAELQGAVEWEAGTGEMSEGVRDALRKAVAISKGGKG